MDEQRLGFVRDKLDIKILILFILRRLPAPIDGNGLAELAICEDSISYFDYSECLAELVESAHVSLTEAGYAITDKGRKNGEIIEGALPYTVRLAAERAVSKVAKQLRRDELISTSHTPRGRGFETELALSDDVGQVISMRIYCVSEAMAERIERNFRRQAEDLAASLLDSLTKEE